MSLVEARELFCVYPGADGGVAALQGLSLDVEEGEVCVVLGPSGSGKTTLMRVLAGFEHPSAGSIVVAGANLGALSQGRLAAYRATTLGYADQHYWRALAGELTAEELIARAARAPGARRAPPGSRARTSCWSGSACATGAQAHPHELSGGEQQRIALCAALANRPRLLIADEPTGELDELSAAAVYSLLAELSREEGVTALVVSHDPRSAAIADRVVHIRDGRVSEERHGDGAAVVIGRGGSAAPARGRAPRGRHRRPRDGLGARRRRRAEAARCAPGEPSDAARHRGCRRRRRRAARRVAAVRAGRGAERAWRPGLLRAGSRSSPALRAPASRRSSRSWRGSTSLTTARS